MGACLWKSLTHLTDRLLAMNDLINSVVSKYEDFERGVPITKSVIDIKRYELVQLRLIISTETKKHQLVQRQPRPQKWGPSISLIWMISCPLQRLALLLHLLLLQRVIFYILTHFAALLDLDAFEVVVSLMHPHPLASQKQYPH